MNMSMDIMNAYMTTIMKKAAAADRNTMITMAMTTIMKKAAAADRNMVRGMRQRALIPIL